MAPSQEAVENFNSAYRQVVRRRARGVIGSTMSSFLTPALPYMAIPAGVRLYSIDKADKARAQLGELEKQGFRPRKRDVILGATQAGLEKMILIPITLGHDELLLATHGATSSFAADAVANHADLLKIDGIHEFNQVVQIPTDAVNSAVGVQTAGERVAEMNAAVAHGTPLAAVVDTGGLHDPHLNVATLAAGGATAATVEYITDRPFAYKDERAVYVATELVDGRPVGQIVPRASKD